MKNILETIKEMRPIVKDFNESKDVIHKERLLQSLIDNYPTFVLDYLKRKCKITNGLIVYPNSSLSILRDGTVKTKYGSSGLTKKKILDKEYSLLVSYRGLLTEYPEAEEKNVSKLFNTCNKFTTFCFDVPKEDVDKRNKSTAVTLERMIRDYGEVEGKKRFDSYREKQAKSNSFEYKQKKYGWTKEQFDEYNKSRAVTLEHLIERHGKEKGTKMWNDYCKRQSETSKDDYIKSVHGEKHLEYVINARRLNRVFFYEKYKDDPEMAERKWQEEIKRKQKTVNSSNIANEMFSLIVEKYNINGIINEDRFYYANNKNKEKPIDVDNGNDVTFVDFYDENTRKIIEFNGKMYHADPRFYKSTDLPIKFKNVKEPLTAQEIWDRDKERMDTLKELGYKVMIVWETDFHSNPEKVIDECVAFLNK